jgi:hypothetical protein
MAKILTHLEMTHPSDLRPSPAVPGLELQRVEPGTPLLRSVHVRVGAPHGWRGTNRTDQDWLEHEQNQPECEYRLITLAGEPVGLVNQKPQAGGDVEISTFGLVPESVGRGLGGYALTLGLRQAWAGEGVRRVWLHTVSSDHPHALANYQARGMRVFLTEIK